MIGSYTTPLNKFRFFRSQSTAVYISLFINFSCSSRRLLRFFKCPIFRSQSKMFKISKQMDGCLGERANWCRVAMSKIRFRIQLWQQNRIRTPETTSEQVFFRILQKILCIKWCKLGCFILIWQDYIFLICDHDQSGILTSLKTVSDLDVNESQKFWIHSSPI